MKILFRIVLFSLSIVVLANCTASKKAEKETKKQTEEQKTAQKMCDCLGPLIPAIKKLETVTDTEERMALMQELETIGQELEVCGKEIEVTLAKKKEALGSDEFKMYEKKLEEEMKVICPETYEILDKVSPK